MLQGYAIGNGVTDDEADGNAIIPFAYGKALLSTELYTELVQECRGNFWNATEGKTVHCMSCFFTQDVANTVVDNRRPEKHGAQMFEHHTGMRWHAAFHVSLCTQTVHQ